ncbi:helicase associated domain-containing protein [Blautia sp. RD014234]|nr:helicase associated domain-containing protein [Blautia parvula]
MASGNYKKQTWDEWYGCAKAYYEEKGNLLVPGRYKTMDGYSLGRWIERQRARYNGLHDNMIHTDEVIALEKIGMVWKLENRLSWEQWIYMAENYYLQYGNLEVHTAFTVDGYRLGYWVREQRKSARPESSQKTGTGPGTLRHGLELL